jgi:hypothetical protein
VATILPTRAIPEICAMGVTSGRFDATRGLQGNLWAGKDMGSEPWLRQGVQQDRQDDNKSFSRACFAAV